MNPSDKHLELAGHTRRTVLKALGAGVAGVACLPVITVRSAYAVSAPSAGNDGRLVVLFLRGAMDGLFTFAPVDDRDLVSLRPNLSRKAVEEGIRLTGTGFVSHPAAKDLADLFNAGELLFCPTAGTNDTSRSHFQAQDLFELGSGAIRGDSGFMARLSTALGNERPDLGAVSFTREVPLAFQGGEIPPQVAPLSGSGLRLPDGRVLDAIRKAHAGLKTGEAIDQAIATQTEIDAAVDVDGAARGAVQANGLPKIAAHMGRILRTNRRLALAFIDLGGFDTHAAQEAILSRALESLSGGLLALRDALGPEEWARTRVVAMTEFGRTVRENGTQGTDHGHGGLFILAGGGIGGRRMIGSFDGLSASALNEDRDLPVLADWRDLMSAVATSNFGLPDRTLDAVFPGRPKAGFAL